MKRGPYTKTRTLQPPNPTGICQCGKCGLTTSRATMSNVAIGNIAGEFVRFTHGHQPPGPRPLQNRVQNLTPPNPSGVCQCARCGLTTVRARQSNTKTGNVKGEYVRFIKNHHGKVTIEYIVEDRGYKTPCWIWQLAIDDYGYAKTSVLSRAKLAHREYYKKLKGPIPDGYDLDHLCRVRCCVNPEHLEPVTPQVNQWRKWESIRQAARVRRLTDKLL